MNKKLATVLRYLVFAGIAGVLVWYIFRDQSLGNLLDSARQMNYWWIVLSMLVAVPGYIIRAKRWNLLLESLGYKPSLSNSTKAVSMAYMFNLAFPRLGEVTRCTVLNRTDKIPLNTLIGTVVAERTIDVVCLLILIFTVILLRIETLGSYLIKNFFSPIGEKINVVATNPLYIALAVIAVAGSIIVFRMVMNRTKFGAKLKGFVADFTSGLLAVFRLKKLGQFFVLTLLLWFVYFSMMYVCFFGIPAVKSLDIVDALFLFVMGSLGMAAPTPGGTGTYHVFVTEGFVLVGIAASQGLVLATVFHLSQISTSCILGAISLLTLPKKQSDGQAAGIKE